VAFKTIKELFKNILQRRRNKMRIERYSDDPLEYWKRIEVDFSAETVFSPEIKAFCLAILLILSVAHISTNYFAAFYTVMCMNGLYFFANTYRLLLFLNGLRILASTEEEDGLITLKNEELPSYTILIPLFKEAAVIPKLVQALDRLDYPPEKKQVLIILEEEDDETPPAIAAVKNLPSYFQVIVVPNSLPQTKAKACNYAMKFATGDLTTIFDAEDRPDIDQLKKVAQKFSQSDENAVCIQAKLCYYNAGENWLTGMFSIEYANLFNYVLPAMSRFNFPIPLGGSSNHFRTKILREMRGWDPYNVTEDADLGLRLSARGYKIHTVHSFTHEEAPISLNAWIKQRSRWVKGYFHTFFVYMRHPIFVYRKYGFKGFVFFLYMLFISPFLLATMPIMLYFSGKIILGFYDFPHMTEQVLKYFTVFNLFYGYFGLLFMTFIMKQVQDLSKVRLWFTYPLYFTLHVIAAVLAFYKLLTNPHKWDKTTHGVSKLDQENQA
jgi:cellulose synthase/poly-beta-1,6-N-acetylglucosamine synthase-like glycosyltransferase